MFQPLVLWYLWHINVRVIGIKKQTKLNSDYEIPVFTKYLEIKNLLGPTQFWNPTPNFDGIESPTIRC